MLFRIVIFIVAFLPLTQAQENPFVSPDKRSIRQDSHHAVVSSSTGIKCINRIPFLRGLMIYQKKLNAKLSTLLRRIGNNFSLKAILLLFAFSFLYGIIHSLGPGHGKLIIGSYMLTRNYPVRLSWLAGAIFAATHAGMAVALYYLFSLTFHLSKTSIDSVSANLYRASGFLVACIGVAILIQSIRKKNDTVITANISKGKRSLAAVSFGSGITPCPGTLLLLIFSRLAGVPIYGLISVLFLSIGMAITVTAVAGLSNIAQKTASFSAIQWKNGILVKSIQYVGAIIIILTGLIMLIA